MRNWFNLFDNDKDGLLEPADFKRLLKQAEVIVRDQDLAKVFELIDLQQTGRIAYTDFLAVIEKNVTLPIEQIVRKRRKERGEAFVEGAGLDPHLHPEEAERLRAFKSHQAELNSSKPRDIGSVEGLSQIMGRSDQGDHPERHLIDDDDTLHHYTEIKELLRQHFNSFDDLLAKMGKPAYT